MVPGANVMFLVAVSFLGGATADSLSFFRLLYGTKRRTGPVCNKDSGGKTGILKFNVQAREMIFTMMFSAT